MVLAKVKQIVIRTYNRGLKKLRRLKVATILETIEEVKKGRSLVRFGDGEIIIIRGGSIGFQKCDAKLAQRLEEVLSVQDEQIMVSVPGPLGERYSQLTEKAADWWRGHTEMEYYVWIKYLNTNRQYYDSMMSRFYVGIKDHELSKQIVESLKGIWEGKRVLIVEGFMTRMGLGNDLFENAAMIGRVLCPSRNAFEKYDEILQEVAKHADRFDLVLISLGPTAKVLTYDLYKKGFWVVDIGHVDNEYEWFLAGKGKRVAIENKFCNEIEGGNIEDQSINDEKYNSEIVAKVI